MTSPYECIMGKDVPKRLKDKLMAKDALVKASNPGLDEVSRAALVFDMIDSELKQNQRNLLKQAEVQQRIETSLEGKTDAAKARTLMNLYEGNDMRLDAENLSVAGVRSVERAIMDGIVAKFYQNFTRRLWTPGTSRAKGLQRNIAKETFGIKTGDSTAKEMAEAFRQMEKYVVDQMRLAGARMGLNPDRQFLVSHNTAEVGKVSKEVWAEGLLDKLDFNSMIDYNTNQPFTRTSIIPVLHELHDVIRTGGAANKTPGRKQYLAAWQRADQRRFFVWKDFASWESYNKEFGYGEDYFTAIVQYIDKSSRDLAMFKVLGPDWDATNNYVKDLAAKIAGDRDPSKAPGRVQKLERAQELAKGTYATPGNSFLAEKGESFRNTIGSSILGSTFLTQITTDPFLQAMARQMNGLTMWNQIPQFVSALTSFGFRGSKSQKAALMLRLGIPIQSIQHSVLGSMRGIGEFDGGKLSHLLADTNYRASGMTVWTDAQQASFGSEFVLSLTENLGKKFNNFNNTNLSKTLNAYGVTEQEWLKLSQSAPTFSNGGVKYLDILKLTESDYGNAARLLQMIHTEMQTRGVLTSTPTSKRILHQGTTPGTAMGETVRTVTHLISWPATMIWTQIAARIVDPNGTILSKAMQVSSLFLGLTILGGMSAYINDVLSTKQPPKLDDPRFMMTAIAKGGGWGLIGDLLMRESYGSSDLLSKTMGPGLGIIGDAALIPIQGAQALVTGETDGYHPGRMAVDLARQTTPLSSLWFAKAGIDRLVFDQIQLLVDEDAHDYWRNADRRMEQKTGQTRWWEHGELLPSSAPDFGEPFK